jgi:hypothetical protein
MYQPADVVFVQPRSRETPIVKGMIVSHPMGMHEVPALGRFYTVRSKHGIETLHEDRLRRTDDTITFEPLNMVRPDASE